MTSSFAVRSPSTRRSNVPSPPSPSASATSSRRSTTCSASPIAETRFEPHVGGHIYDRGEDGSECRWARVLAYEPPNRVVFSWDISPYWQVEADEAKTSEVEVTFVAETPTRTRLELVHRNLDRHGPGWEGLAAGVGDDARLAAVPRPLRRARRRSGVGGAELHGTALHLALALVVAIVVFRKPIARMLVVAGGGLRAGIIGLSRLELGVHWPTDVMAG